jgi:hypothetical protein
MATLNISPISFSDADLTDKKQLKKIENYLYQMTEQLRFTLNNLSLDDLGDLKGAIDGDMLKNGSIGDDKLYSRFMLADTVHAKYATIEKLIADDGYLRDLRVDVLNAKTAVFGDLETNGLQADVANISSILAGNIGTGSLQTLVINSTNATIANATIKSAMIDSISTSDVEIASDDGNLQIIDNTIQIKDSTRVRVQLGKDAEGDYNLYVWDTDGNLMFDALGLHEAGIKSGIIRDDMVASNANISGAKIFIDDFGESGETLATTISVMNGYLESIISSTDIAEFEDGETFYTRYSALKQSYDSFSSTVSSSITDLDERMDTAESSILQNANSIALKVSSNGVISAINLSEEEITIDGSKVNITGNTTFNSLTAEVEGVTVINGSKVKTGTIESINGVSSINLNDGTFSFANGNLVWDGDALALVGELSGEYEIYNPTTETNILTSYKIGHSHYFGWSEELYNDADIYLTGIHISPYESGAPELFIGDKAVIDELSGTSTQDKVIEAAGSLAINSLTGGISMTAPRSGISLTAGNPTEHDDRGQLTVNGYGIYMKHSSGAYVSTNGVDYHKVLTYSFPQSVYIEDGGGMDLNNSDILGANGIFFRDEANSAREGIFFPKQGVSGSTDYADYHRLYVYRGKLYLDGQEIAFVQ